MPIDDGKDSDALFKKVETALQDKNLSKKELKKMKDKLKEWGKKDAQMAPSKAWLKSAFSDNTGRAHNKRYSSYEELGLALLGHIRSRQHKKTEASLSEKTKKSSYIKGRLQEVQQAIYTTAEAISDDILKQKFWSGMGGQKGLKGEYQYWYKGVKDVKKMLQGGTGDFKQAITSIHDATSVMLNVSSHYGAGKSDKQKAFDAGVLDTWTTDKDGSFSGTKEEDDGEGGKKTVREPIKYGYRNNSDTVNESYDWVKRARENGALLWAGPSHTTSDMMRMMEGLTQKVNTVTVKHYEAVAWAIFAFWNKDFLTFKDGYHTFHEVMDIASRVGVPYTPFVYPSKPPSS